MHTLPSFKITNGKDDCQESKCPTDVWEKEWAPKTKKKWGRNRKRQREPDSGWLIWHHRYTFIGRLMGVFCISILEISNGTQVLSIIFVLHTVFITWKWSMMGRNPLLIRSVLHTSLPADNALFFCPPVSQRRSDIDKIPSHLCHTASLFFSFNGPVPVPRPQKTETHLHIIPQQPTEISTYNNWSSDSTWKREDDRNGTKFERPFNTCWANPNKSWNLWHSLHLPLTKTATAWGSGVSACSEIAVFCRRRAEGSAKVHVERHSHSALHNCCCNKQ